MFRHYNQRFVSCLLFLVTHDVQTIIGCNNENETKNYKITGLTILVLFWLHPQKSALFHITPLSPITISLVNQRAIRL